MIDHSKENNFYKLQLSEIYEKLDTNPSTGLSTVEAEKRLEKFGPNALPKVSRGFIKIYLSPLFNWLIVIYLMGALILFLASLFGYKSNFVIIALTLGIVLLNCLVAIIQQYRATKKLEALRELSAPTTKVIRDGQKMEIATSEVVIGDLLDIEQGDKIPADARIVSENNLEVNEASLTGESEPSRKDAEEGPIEKDLDIQDRENMLYYGTYITRGKSKAIVTQIGASTEIGKISEGLKAAGTTAIPIREKMNTFGKWLGIAVLIFWFITLMIVWIGSGFSRFEIVKSLNSALDILPINIPLLTTIVLLTGVLAMAQQGVIIRNLASVDSLGRVSVVCTDKTGTLTRNQMVVKHIWSNGSNYEVTGKGYKPDGDLILVDDPKKPKFITHIEEYPHLKLLLISGFLNNNSALIKSEVETSGKEAKMVEKWKVVGSPTEGALVVLFQKIMGSYLLEDYEFIEEFPFDSDIKRMTKIYQEGEKYFSFTKGASEILIPRSSQIYYEGREVEFTDELKEMVQNKIENFASQGYRILSLCYKDFYMMPSDAKGNREEFESDLVYLGFITISDPPREGVKESVNQCKNAGIDVVMITGDSTITGKAIGEQIDIINNANDKVIEGREIENIKSKEEFNNIKVFARVSPTHKEDIVKNYKNQDRVVAMTGDGVNDSLALNMADCGLAMGITGTDVAKEASDMVISDDSFNSIATGVHQGRGIFSKIRAVVFFYICINLFEGIVQFILAIILNLPYFLSDQFYFQWVFLSLTLHALPGFILTFDTISDDVMKENPRNSEEIISKNTLFLLVSFGALLTISMFLVYFLSYTGIYPVFYNNYELGPLGNTFYLSIEDYIDMIPAQDFLNLTFPKTFSKILTQTKTLTMLMVTLFFCETFLVFQIRRPNKSLVKSMKEDRNKLMFIITGFLFLLFLLLIYTPGVQTTLASLGFNFMFMFLQPLDWIICFLISLITIICFEIVKYLARKRNIVF
jgi:Ca2+-transporting ATPase